MRYMLQAAARELLPGERVGGCLRIVRDAHVGVKLTPEGKAHYTGLCVCGSIWQCPVCAPNISEKRRIEIDKAVKLWVNEHNGNLVLVTFTMRHKKWQPLHEVRTVVRGAYTHMQKSKNWDLFCNKHNVVGYTSDFEITEGKNGWHPHIHMLNFMKPGFNIKTYTNQIKEKWIKEVQRLGGDASWEYGVDVRVATEDIAAYIAKFGREPKWTVAHELTKSVSKLGRAGGRTPMELLRDYALHDDEKAGELWKEYALTMKGYKQLHWSKGKRDIRKMLGLGKEKTDEELINQREEHSRYLVLLDRRQWRIILANDARAELLIVAEMDNERKLANFLVNMGVFTAEDLDQVVSAGDQADELEQSTSGHHVQADAGRSVQLDQVEAKRHQIGAICRTVCDSAGSPHGREGCIPKNQNPTGKHSRELSITKR